jgi:hypothetical protein
MAVWGDMAKRQYQERQKAERENVRLKLILERQLKMAKSLEKILRNRHNNQVRFSWVDHWSASITTLTLSSRSVGAVAGAQRQAHPATFSVGQPHWR